MYGKTTKKDEDCITRRVNNIGEIKDMLNVNTLGYATIEDIEEAIGLSRDELCLECWTR